MPARLQAGIVSGCMSEFRTGNELWCLYVGYCHVTNHPTTQWLNTTLIPSLCKGHQDGSASQSQSIMSPPGQLSGFADFEQALPGMRQLSSGGSPPHGFTSSSSLACSCPHNKGRGPTEKASVHGLWGLSLGLNILHVDFFTFS